MRPVPTLTKTFYARIVGEISLDCDTLHIADRDQHPILDSAPPSRRPLRRSPSSTPSTAKAPQFAEPASTGRFTFIAPDHRTLTK